MLISYRTVFCCLAFFLTTDFATAHDSNQAPSPSQICSRLLQRMGSGVMISSHGAKYIQRDAFIIYRAVSPTARVLAEQLTQLSFGKKIIEEVPMLGRAEWFSMGQNIATQMRSQSGRNFLITMDPQGMIEIRIWSAGDLSNDQSYSEKIISLLRHQGVEAVLSAKTGILPHDPKHGFELWISHLDANNPTTRIGVAKLLTFLRAS